MPRLGQGRYVLEADALNRVIEVLRSYGRDVEAERLATSCSALVAGVTDGDVREACAERDDNVLDPGWVLERVLQAKCWDGWVQRGCELIQETVDAIHGD